MGTILHEIIGALLLDVGPVLAGFLLRRPEDSEAHPCISPEDNKYQHPASSNGTHGIGMFIYIGGQ